jgi:tetratricopeptide (TPR) repeat protein
MPDQVMQLAARKPFVRLLMIFALAFGLIWSWFVVRWYLANTLAEYLRPEENSVAGAKLAVSLGPNDPLTHWRLGEFTQKKLPSDQVGQMVKEYEKAASLSPNDYRFWMAFGTALEQVGEEQRAEEALRRAVKLAPSYSFPRWYLGNCLLRSGHFAEAFTELQRSSEADPELRSQLFNLAWELYNNDFESLKSSIGNKAEARAQFSQYLLGQGRFEDGLRLWGTLSESEKKDNRAAGEAMLGSLMVAKHFHQAVAVWNDLVPDIPYRAALGQVVDGGFEVDFAQRPRAVFGWQVQSLQQVPIAIDPRQAHSGSRSLSIVFQVRSRLNAVNLSQLVPVQPDTQYDFECYVKTQKLVSAATPVVALVDAMDGSVVATSEPAPDEDSDWQRVALTFKTGAKTEALTLQINRASCGENPVCPIYGTLWYDDFNLKPRN